MTAEKPEAILPASGANSETRLVKADNPDEATARLYFQLVLARRESEGSRDEMDNTEASPISSAARELCPIGLLYYVVQNHTWNRPDQFSRQPVKTVKKTLSESNTAYCSNPNLDSDAERRQKHPLILRRDQYSIAHPYCPYSNSHGEAKSNPFRLERLSTFDCPGFRRYYKNRSSDSIGQSPHIVINVSGNVSLYGNPAL
ncbi:hypothetical protein V1517DRAFT_305035 [Lipomyces orientalis]|uniref:Uncharacterized protein n=1 Tax=Lipomyces orientalis TaxID=1233043 RepID=A0ACC3TXR9_9ASCO